MWEIIPKIGTPIALAAFALGVVAVICRLFIDRNLRLIKEVPEKDRAIFIQQFSENAGIELPADLAPAQKLKFLKERLHERATRFKISAIVAVTLAGIIAAVVVVAILNPGSRQSP